MQDRNIILTGLPRSGTTLTCHLLNKVPNTVALHEPINVFQWASLPYPFHEVICKDIDRFYGEMRRTLLDNGTAISGHVRGKVPDNPYGDFPALFSLLPKSSWWRRIAGRRVLRKPRHSRGFISFDKALSSDFLLCIKHNAGFTALLEPLSCHYPCVAIIRNPLSILASWNSIRFNIQTGRVPAAEMLDQALAQRLSEIDSRIDRQLLILSWFFEKFERVLPRDHVIRYEALVASGGQALAVITPHALELNEPLENKNKNKLYDRELMARLGEKLLKMDGPFWEFYSKESVEQLLNGLTV